MSSSASRLEQTPLFEMYRFNRIVSEEPKSSLAFSIFGPYSGAGAALCENDFPPRLSFEKNPLFLSPRSSESENLERFDSPRSSLEKGLSSFGVNPSERFLKFPPRDGLSDELSLRSNDLRGFGESFESSFEYREGRFVSSPSSRDRLNGFSSREEYPSSERFLKLPPRDGLSDESSLRSNDLRGFGKSFESPLSENLDGRFTSSRSSRERENGLSPFGEKPSDRFLKFPSRLGLSDESSLRSYDLLGFEKSLESPREDLKGFLESPPRDDRSPLGESEREEFVRAPLRPEGFLLPLPAPPESSRLGIWFF
jgi:hypothetical protein